MGAPAARGCRAVPGVTLPMKIRPACAALAAGLFLPSLSAAAQEGCSDAVWASGFRVEAALMASYATASAASSVGFPLTPAGDNFTAAYSPALSISVLSIHQESSALGVRVTIVLPEAPQSFEGKAVSLAWVDGELAPLGPLPDAILQPHPGSTDGLVADILIEGQTAHDMYEQDYFRIDATFPDGKTARSNTLAALGNPHRKALTLLEGLLGKAQAGECTPAEG
uniref:Uncharacterized protein n=2 Tax=Aquisalinus luteolus TaxID=1566827 RepID=A0A8J3ERV3_9PROT|nr:hypothetical protein GCM10011355_28420 [Aquisalinus luteolus]